MKKDKIISIAFNFSELLEELEELQKYNRLSLNVSNLLKRRQIDARNPWYEYRNGKWAVMRASEDYIMVRPYEVFCEDYLNTKRSQE